MNHSRMKRQAREVAVAQAMIGGRQGGIKSILVCTISPAGVWRGPELHVANCYGMVKSASGGIRKKWQGAARRDRRGGI